MSAHAKRALRTKVSARITAVLDAGIAMLQRLRQKAGGAQDGGEDEGRPGSRRGSPRERQGAATPPPAEAPKPKRRLRAFLIYLSVMLAGSLAGGALSYVQFQKQLGQQRKESQRLEAALAKKTRPSAEIRKAFEEEQARRTQAEKKLASSLTEYAAGTSDSYNLLESLLGQQLAESRRLEAALAENVQSSAEARKALAEAQAGRADAEEKLAASLAEHAQSATEKQKQLDAAERQLATAEKKLARLLADEGTHSAQPEAPVSRRRSDSTRSPRPVKSRNCTLDTKNVDSLKGCIEDFNQ